MNKIIFTYLTASETLFKFAYSQTVVVLFLVLTVSQLCAAQSSKSANLPSENELPTLKTKAKPGLIRVQNNLVYGENNSSVQIGRAALVFDDIYAYVSTPNGLYSTPKQITANSSFELIGFQNKSIINLTFTITCCMSSNIPKKRSAAARQTILFSNPKTAARRSFRWTERWRIVTRVTARF